MIAGHEERVRELADCHGQMVFRAAYRVLGNIEDAEDVLQSVFLRLLDSRAKADPPQDWGAFLRVMATHAAIDLLRQRSKRNRVDAEEIENLPAPESSLPGHTLEQRRLADLLRGALAQLPARDACVFTLRHFEECSYEEIVHQQNLSISQVGVILHRARIRLRAILEPLLAAGKRKD